jgi:hypothetical protein
MILQILRRKTSPSQRLRRYANTNRIWGLSKELYCYSLRLRGCVQSTTTACCDTSMKAVGFVLYISSSAIERIQWFTCVRSITTV